MRLEGRQQLHRLLIVDAGDIQKSLEVKTVVLLWRQESFAPVMKMGLKKLSSYWMYWILYWILVTKLGRMEYLDPW